MRFLSKSSEDFATKVLSTRIRCGCPPFPAKISYLCNACQKTALKPKVVLLPTSLHVNICFLALLAPKSTSQQRQHSFPRYTSCNEINDIQSANGCTGPLNVYDQHYGLSDHDRRAAIPTIRCVVSPPVDVSTSLGFTILFAWDQDNISVFVWFVALD